MTAQLGELNFRALMDKTRFVETLLLFWNQLKHNFSRLLWELANRLLEAGQLVLNFLFSAILFFTALFYLLSARDSSSFKPFKWFLFIFPTDGPRQLVEQSISQAINEVLLSLFKLCLFHGLWTYLTLTLLGVRIVYISTLLTIVVVVLPVMGPYWACLPACLELWLVSGKWVHAVVLFGLHFVANWVIDPKIYSESSGHYYVTGLSVVGGVYFLGVEGALVGPMLLCVVIFLHKILNELLNNNNNVET